MSKNILRSVCPYDCPDTCGLLVEVKGGKAVKVSGDPEHPFTRGTLCVKMNSYPKTVHSPLRLTHALLRTGAKGSGEYRLISWEEAINRIVRALAKDHRSVRLGGYSSLLLCWDDGSHPAERRTPFFLSAWSLSPRSNDLLSGQRRGVEIGDGRNAGPSS